MSDKDLLKKYLSGRISKNEVEQLLRNPEFLRDASASEERLKQLWKDTANSNPLSPEDSRRILIQLRHRLQKETFAQRQNVLHRFYYSAAVITGLLIGGLLIYHLTDRQTPLEFITGYGETRTITLPDSTTVVLNANSSLRYQLTPGPEYRREVWLDGEAFFSVSHTADHQPFRVYVTDEVSVEVLGTEFNVSDRRKKTQVVLNTGKVTLAIRDQDQPQSLTMQPGELVEFSEVSKTLVKKQVNPERYAAWRHRKMIFEETPLREIASTLEDQYGVPIIIEDSSLANTRLTGAFPTQNLEMILNSLPTIVEMEVHSEPDTIRFNRK